MKQGNRCLYYSKQLFNSLLIVAGALLIAIGVYIWTETKTFSIIEMAFIGLGLIQMLLGFFGKSNYQLVLSSKRASMRIKCYNYFLGILFVGSVIGLILGFTLKEQLIEKAAEQQKSSTQSIAELEELINKNVSIALYVTISCLAIQLLALLFSIWYSDSLETLNENFEMIYDEKSKKYVSFEEYKAQQKVTVQTKTEERRNEYYEKNPEFYKWKQEQQKKP